MESSTSFDINRQTYSNPPFTSMTIEDRAFHIKDTTRVKTVDLYTLEAVIDTVVPEHLRMY